jgi:hypothetical protein
MPQWSRWRDALRHISEAVDILVHDGVLSRVDGDIVQEGRRKVGIIYHMHASPEFLARLYRSKRFADDNRRELAGRRCAGPVRTDRCVSHHRHSQTAIATDTAGAARG